MTNYVSIRLIFTVTLISAVVVEDDFYVVALDPVLLHRMCDPCAVSFHISMSFSSVPESCMRLPTFR